MDENPNRESSKRMQVNNFKIPEIYGGTLDPEELTKLPVGLLENTENADDALVYARALFDLVTIHDKEKGKTFLERLKLLSERFENDIEIASIYANGQYKYLLKQNLDDRKESIDELKLILIRFPGNVEISKSLAKGLYAVFISANESLKNEILKELKDLLKQFSKEEEIALVYAKGLLYFLRMKKFNVATAYELKRISNQFPNCMRINRAEAELLNVAYKYAERNNTSLEELEEIFWLTDDKEIAHKYANCLMEKIINLDQDDRYDDFEHIEYIVEELGRLLNRYYDDENIALAYVKGLNVLLKHQGWSFIDYIKLEIEEIVNRFPDNSEIQQLFAEVLARQLFDDERNLIWTKENLKKIYEMYPDNINLALIFARWLDYPSDKNVISPNDVAQEIGIIFKRFPDNIDLAEIYANSLFDSFADQDYVRGSVKITNFKKLCERFSSNEEIKQKYIKAIGIIKERIFEINLELDQFYDDPEGARAYADILLDTAEIPFNISDQNRIIFAWQALSEKFNDNSLTNNYAKYLCILFDKHDELIHYKIRNELRVLLDRFPSNSNIINECEKRLIFKSKLSPVYELATMYVDLIADPEGDNKRENMQKLRQCSGWCPDNDEIAHLYALGLVNLLFDPFETELNVICDELRDIFERFSNNEEIAYQYACGLVRLIFKQQKPEKLITIEALRELSNRFNTSKITFQYAKAILNLAFEEKMIFGKSPDHIMMELHQRFKDDSNIALVYSKIISNLMLKGEISRKIATFKLKELANKYNADNRIAHEYERAIK